MTPRPTIGRLVHFVLNVGPNQGEHRPAVVVNVIDEKTIDLQVFTCGTRDCYDQLPNMFFKKSSLLDEHGQLPGSWHFPEGAPK